MRLLMLPRYGPLGASSRVRMYQYVPALEAAGFSVQVSPLFDDSYVSALYERRRAWGTIAKGYLRRVSGLLGSHSQDVVWIEKELLPWVAERVEGLARPRTAVAVDYDDAVFHRYDEHASGFVRRVLGGKIDAVMRGADLVTAGNAYLADRATAAGAPWVERLPTVIDLQRYTVRTPSDGGGPVVIGWIGSPATAEYLKIVTPALQQLARTRSIRCVAVGAREDQVQGTPFEVVPWSEPSEAEQVAAFDIGVMPLPDESWERGKCGYKLIQYMACGVPVVASPVGVNTEIVTPGVNGELAGSSEQWLTALTGLVDHPTLRARQGNEGRRRVEEWYSLQAQAPRLVAMLREAANRRRT